MHKRHKKVGSTGSAKTGVKKGVKKGRHNVAKDRNTIGKTLVPVSRRTPHPSIIINIKSPRDIEYWDDPPELETIDINSVDEEESDEESDSCKSTFENRPVPKVRHNERIGSVFDIDPVDGALVGTPAEVRDELDGLAIKLQRHPSNQDIFLKIVSYMHKYILGLVFKKYSFVMGNEEKDMYNESLSALYHKAVPRFRRNRGMSFLNFAKMCINRRLITILHQSRHRIKNLPLNTASSLDHSPIGAGEDDDDCQLSNVISNKKKPEAPFDKIVRSESFRITLETVKKRLSGFEQKVLDEYLDEKSYKLAARSIRQKHGEKCNAKSIDNALLRIRKKATDARNEEGSDALPLL